MPTVFFGEPWDTPVLDGTLPVDTPVGHPCNACQEPIARGDRGLIELDQTNDPHNGRVTQIHAECRLEQVVAPLMGGTCFCLALPPGRTRSREIWTHFFNPDGSSLWPRTTTR